jgi:hypothetical protein
MLSMAFLDKAGRALEQRLGVANDAFRSVREAPRSTHSLCRHQTWESLNRLGHGRTSPRHLKEPMDVNGVDAKYASAVWRKPGYGDSRQDRRVRMLDT